MLITSIYEERELLTRIAAGDEGAFRVLFHRYNKILQPFIVKLTKSEGAAEEVLQEVWLKVWMHRAKLAGVEHPKAYIVRIVTNESMDYLRSEVRKRMIAQRMSRVGEGEMPSPEQSYSMREMEQRLQEAVEGLPVACQQVYRMSREQYKCIPEIATELNLSHSTVKNQLVKALKRIRVHIGNVLPFLFSILVGIKL